MSKSFHKRYLESKKPYLDISLQQKMYSPKMEKMWHAYGWVCKSYKPKKNPDMEHALYMNKSPENMSFMTLCPNYMSNYDNKITRKPTSCLKETNISSEYSCLENTLTATSCNNMDTISTTQRWQVTTVLLVFVIKTGKNIWVHATASSVYRSRIVASSNPHLM